MDQVMAAFNIHTTNKALKGKAAFNDSAPNFGGPHEADNLIVVIFYLLVSLHSNEAQFLGARFIEECSYIDSFMHED